MCGKSDLPVTGALLYLLITQNYNRIQIILLYVSYCLCVTGRCTTALW